MKITRLILRNFRNYELSSIPLTSGINWIYGKNGAGKTSLLEALFLLSTGRSFLTSHLKDVIRKGASHFYIEVHFIRDSVEQTLSIGFDEKQRRIHYNQTTFHNFTHVLGILPSVLYSPKDSSLISGSPQDRRRFLNIQLAQTDPLYVHYLVRFHKAMKHRNALLKIKSEASIESWEKMMAEAARYLMQKREELIGLLRPRMMQYAQELSEGEDYFGLHYEPSIALKKMDSIEELLLKHRPKEFILGTTLIGPHRDDFKVTYQENEAKSFASEGQKRTCIMALKLGEWEVLQAKTETTPLLAIDDFNVHLDPRRSALLHEKLSSFGQVLLTSPTLEAQEGLHIENGKVLNLL